MTDETILVALVKQYANRFGITFSSAHLDDEDKRQKLITLMQEAMAGERGPVTDEDLD